MIYLAITALFAGWAIAQIRSGEAYLNFTGRFTRQESPTVFWGVCAVKLFFAAVCALAALKLLTHR
ncbi:hypothetical protein [Caulobacter sp.]|uniref:hypothetical protein n=1 Tax=Caulobacter sp. TaxID=78 RepID=UPI002B45CAC5|nr:hypothetical protein [Caulobacter sp.]HJV40681.1 hypothetical protein [Caulobacter sp.]